MISDERNAGLVGSDANIPMDLAAQTALANQTIEDLKKAVEQFGTLDASQRYWQLYRLRCFAQVFSQRPLPPQLKHWALAQHTTEEVLAALKEAREQGTFELRDFIGDLEKVVKDHDPTAR